MAQKHIAVVGAGAWGTALAIAMHRAGNNINLYTRNQQVVDDIQATGQNSHYLPDIAISSDIQCVSEAGCISSADAIIMVVPAQYLRENLEALPISNTTPLILACKGVENHSLKLMSEVAEEVCPTNPVLNISGPNFADEVAKGLPSATTLAGKDQSLTQELAEAMNHPMFKLYLSEDITGSQIGGAVKNIIAIACGIAKGKGFGENAKAALITRSLAEMKRLVEAKKGNPLTLMGLSGVGDLVLSCNSEKSRNMSLGMALGQGQSLEEIQASRHTVAEGVVSSRAVNALAGQLGLDMPICKAVYRILHKNAEIDYEIKGLLDRPFSVE